MDTGERQLYAEEKIFVRALRFWIPRFSHYKQCNVSSSKMITDTTSTRTSLWPSPQQLACRLLVDISLPAIAKHENQNGDTERKVSHIVQWLAAEDVNCRMVQFQHALNMNRMQLSSNSYATRTLALFRRIMQMTPELLHKADMPRAHPHQEWIEMALQCYNSDTSTRLREATGTINRKLQGK